MTPISVPLLALCFLSACVAHIEMPEGTSVAVQVSPDDACGARGLQSFVGQDESVVFATRFQAPGAVRVLGPDDVVSHELDPRRINFRTDASGRIVAVDCG